MLLRFDLKKKLKNSCISTDFSAEKCFKWNRKASRSSKVSSELVRAPFFVDISNRNFSCSRATSEKVNNEENKDDEGLFEVETCVKVKALSSDSAYASLLNGTNIVIKLSNPTHLMVCCFVESKRTVTRKRNLALNLKFDHPISHTLCRLTKCMRAEALNPRALKQKLPINYELHSASQRTGLKTREAKSKSYEDSFCFCYSENSFLYRKNVAGLGPKARLSRNPSLSQLAKRTNLNYALTKRKLLLSSGSIESNPGPEPRRKRDGKGSTILVMSHNIRGLGEERKLRHLINYCYKETGGVTDKDFIFCFQETYINNPLKIPFLWRGNYHLTNGNGHKCGCLTLLSSHINVVHSVDFEDRGHLLVCQKAGELKPSYIIVNLYAPCPNSQAKVDFFEGIFDEISEAAISFECSNIIVAGDFNLNFKASEVKNRMFLAQESRVAQIVSGFIEGSGLKDIWKDEGSFTWRRPNTDSFSTIDRVLYSDFTLETTNVKTEWGISNSDHAAIKVGFKLKEVESKGRSKITRLDPSLLKNDLTKVRFIEEFEEMYAGIGEGWNPHLKLEFAKMCIRTVAERLQAERKKKERSDEEDLNEELNLAVNALAGELSEDDRAEIIDYVEELRNNKSAIIEEKGERLADKLGTKWYNEGEKSTKYFLNLLNRRAPDNFKVVTNREGIEICTQEGIEKEIVNFYKELYEEYDKSNLKEVDVNDDFFKNLSQVSAEQDGGVSSPIGVLELGKTLDAVKDTAPGPDGIPYSFYSATWRITGPLMVEAWNHTISTGKLCPSHKVSFLKLIPKAGKDLKKLTNWRPITLSNCDHKLITKTYANRISSVVAHEIKERQTAYLKGRLINDNIRAILSSINLTNQNEDLDGLIVSLDAKKAFDSVEHSYIEKCLIKFGLMKFVPIFKILYSELSCDIIINGRITKGFKTLRGVKQGDALSCILFIMCMEPLLRNVEENVNIECMVTPIFGPIPKVYAYADDVNAIIKNNPAGLQELFKEYGRLTEASGLELNADKTEIMQLKRRNQANNVAARNFNVNYVGTNYNLETCNEIKINGILFQQDEGTTTQANVDLVLRKIHNILQRWSARHLSTLGKILIVKTFAISQLIYIMQSLVLTDAHFKEINKLLFKFIWNRHFQASKAPERIKRDIVYTPVKYGGLGMLDVSMLDKSLKLRALARLSTSNHPYLSRIFSRLDLSDHFHPKINFELERMSLEGVRLLRELRLKEIGSEKVASDRIYIELVKRIKLENVVSRIGKGSIAYFSFRRQGRNLAVDLDYIELDRLRPFIHRNFFDELRRVSRLRLPVSQLPDQPMLFIKGRKLVEMGKLSSKEIRQEISIYDPICVFKLGAICTPTVSLSWGKNLTKVPSVRHRNILLKVAHGDIYTKEKLYRFGLIPSPECPRCGEVETLIHKFAECNYAKRIWDTTLELTRTLRPFSVNEDRTNLILGAVTESEPLILSIHAEVISRLAYLKDDLSYLLRPKVFVKLALELILKREKSENAKSKIEDILDALNQ